MYFIRLGLTESGWSYSYRDASDIAMNILGNFLSCDVGCSGRSAPTYQWWALDDSQGMAISGNITFLDKEGDHIFLAGQCSEEKDPTELKISRKQFVKLLDDWQKKVCKTKPNEVIIKHENGEFIIETND